MVGSPRNPVSLRMTDDEVALLDKLRESIESRIVAGGFCGTRVSNKTVIMTALRELGKRVEDWDRKR